MKLKQRELGDVFDAVAYFVTTDTVTAKLERILLVTTPLHPIFFLPAPPLFALFFGMTLLKSHQPPPPYPHLIKNERSPRINASLFP